MATKQITVKIQETESDYVFCLNYLYEASLNILRYLMAQKNLTEDGIKKYASISEKKYLELNIAKSELVKFYRPNNIPYKYATFDFDSDTLIYTYEIEDRSNEEKI